MYFKRIDVYIFVFASFLLDLYSLFYNKTLSRDNNIKVKSIETNDLMLHEMD